VGQWDSDLSHRRRVRWEPRTRPADTLGSRRAEFGQLRDGLAARWLPHATTQCAHDARSLCRVRLSIGSAPSPVSRHRSGTVWSRGGRMGRSHSAIRRSWRICHHRGLEPKLHGSFSALSRACIMTFRRPRVDPMRERSEQAFARVYSSGGTSAEKNRRLNRHQNPNRPCLPRSVSATHIPSPSRATSAFR